MSGVGGLFNFAVGGGGGGFDTVLWLDSSRKTRAQLTAPQGPTETDPWAPEVPRTPNSANNENGKFGVIASRGFRKDIICHVYVNVFDHFQCSKKTFGARVHNKLRINYLFN